MFDVDTGAVRHLAAALTERAGTIRDLAVDLHKRVEAVPWEGAAAEAMRSHAGGRLAALLHSADLHDDAGAALTKHADAVDTALALLAGVVDTVTDTVTDIADTVADTVTDAAGTAGSVAQTVVGHTIGVLR